MRRPYPTQSWVGGYSGLAVCWRLACRVVVPVRFLLALASLTALLTEALSAVWGT